MKEQGLSITRLNYIDNSDDVQSKVLRIDTEWLDLMKHLQQWYIELKKMYGSIEENMTQTYKPESPIQQYCAELFTVSNSTANAIQCDFCRSYHSRLDVQICKCNNPRTARWMKFKIQQ